MENELTENQYLIDPVPFWSIKIEIKILRSYFVHRYILFYWAKYIQQIKSWNRKW